MNDLDAAIVGGGPSGLQTARLLARAGFKVGLFEEKKDIGEDVVCTGIVGRDVFQEFELPEDSAVRELRAMTVVGPSGRPLLYEHPSSFARIVDRGRFDRNLARLAQEAGAAVATGTRVLAASTSTRGVRLRLSRAGRSAESVSASFLVLATGVRNGLQKSLHLGAPSTFLSGIQCEVDAPGGDHSAVYLGSGIAPGGFGWSVPTRDGRAKIGLITDGEPRTPFLRLLRSLRPAEAEEAIPESIKVRPIAQGLVSRTSGERVLVVGEAAGQVKTTTGGGIAFGLLGARVAADVIAKAFRAGSFTAAATGEYDRLWRAVLKREIIVGSYVRKAFTALDDSRIERLLDVARQDGVIPLIRAKGDFDWQSGLILDLLRKAPVFRLFREVPRIPSLVKKFWI